MEIDKEKLARAFKLHWQHGTCEIQEYLTIYYPHKKEAKELCEYLKSLGYCGGPYDGIYILNDKGIEEWNKYPHWTFEDKDNPVW